MKTYLLIVFAVFCIKNAEAQRFPVPVLSGSDITIENNNRIRTISVEADTLWIFNGSQFKSALEKAKRLELAEEQLLVYSMQVEIHKERSEEKDSVISVLKRDRDYYKNNWTTCVEDIETEAKKNRRKTLFNRLALTGIPVAFVVGFFLAK